MNIDIPYLDKTISISIPDENLLLVAEPNEFEPEGTEQEILTRAVAAPGIDLSAFLAGAKTVLIIVNDATRPTPTEAMLNLLVPVLSSRGISSEGITVIVATGAHRAPTEAEYRQVLGGHYKALRNSCIAHDARDEDSMQAVGVTRNGTPIVLNKAAFKADRILVTGSVEPHYFAGFTGGRKAFLPGIAAYRTIEANHKLALNPEARALALEGNPVHEDMIDALTHIHAPVFALMTVLDGEQRVAAATAGDLYGSFMAAIDTARAIFCVDVPSWADVVVSVAKFPMDIDLYQSQKAIDNGALALKDGGTLILVSSCRDGIGDEAYADLLASTTSPAEALRTISEGYKLGYHKAAKMAEVSARATVIAKTELNRERLTSMFIEPADSIQAALDAAIKRAKEAGVAVPKVIVLPDGCITVPSVG